MREILERTWILILFLDLNSPVRPRDEEVCTGGNSPDCIDERLEMPTLPAKAETKTGVAVGHV